MTEELLDNLCLPDLEHIYKRLSWHLKEDIYKCFIKSCIDEVFDELNKEYDDCLSYSWEPSPMSIDSTGHWRSLGYEMDAPKKTCNQEVVGEIESICLKCTMTLHKKCNFGCPHRFDYHQYCGLPKITRMINCFLRNPKWNDLFLETYFPDFYTMFDMPYKADHESIANRDGCDTRVGL